MLNMIKTKLNNDDVYNKREEISKALNVKSINIKDTTISAISAVDLQLLFELYDQVFFSNWFKENFKGKLKFSISRRMTKSAGLTLCPKNVDKIKPEELVLEIRIGVDFLFQYGVIKGSMTVGGVKTNNSLDVLLLVFEHELCHVIEFIHFKKSNCKKDRFKAIAGNLFGHTESYHKLPTYKQIAKQKLGINIGDTVSFTYNKKKLTGIIYNINKRATILVRNNKGTLVDNKGNRYSKYYIQLKLLQ